jgi:uncharacterized membrane protein YqjE
MPDTDQPPASFLAVAGRLARTGLCTLQNRIELFALEWEEERIRVVETLVWGVALILLGVLAVLLVTATVIFLFPQELRSYVAVGFAVLYLIGAIIAAVRVSHVVRREPFPESLAQIKKDRAWLESLK